MKKISTTTVAVVTGFSFLVEMICFGSMYSFSMYFAEIVQSLNSTYAIIGMISSCTALLSNSAGPMPGIFVKNTSYAFVIFCAGTCIALAFYVTSYVVNAWEMFFSYSILLGLGCTFSMVSFNFLVDTTGDSFKMAVCVALSSTGLGIIFFSCIAAYLLSIGVSWRLIFRYYALAGVFIATIVSIGFYIYEPEEPGLGHGDISSDECENEQYPILSSSSRSEDPAAVDRKSRGHRDLCGWELLFSCEHPEAWMLFVSHILEFGAQMVPTIYSIVYAAAVAPDNYNIYYYMPISIGLSYFTARIINATLLAHEVYDGTTSTKFLQLGIFAATLTLACIPVSSIGVTAAVLLLGSVTFFQAALFPLILIRTVEVLGESNHLVNVGVQYFALSFSGIAAVYTAGYIYDTTGSFFWLFLFVSLFYPAAFIWDEICFPKRSFTRIIFRAMF